MSMIPIFLYFILSCVVLVYLILAQYTKFFQYPLFNMKLSLNFHFYMVILYIVCFLFCLGFSLLEWYVAYVSELLTPFINQVAYEIVQAEKLQNGIDSSISGSVSSEQQSSLGISVPVPEGKSSTNSSVPSQQPPRHINTPAEEKQGSASAANFFISKLNNYTFNRIDSVTVPDPVFSQAKSNVIQGLRPDQINPVADGPYTPAQLNIPDLNNAEASAPYYSYPVEINGQIKKAHCFNAPAAINAFNDTQELGMGKSNKNSYSQSVARYGLYMQGLGKTTCIITDESICCNLPSLKIPRPLGQEIYALPSPTNNFHTTPGAD